MSAWMQQKGFVLVGLQPQCTGRVADVQDGHGGTRLRRNNRDRRLMRPYQSQAHSTQRTHVWR